MSPFITRMWSFNTMPTVHTERETARTHPAVCTDVYSIRGFQEY